MTAVFPSKTWPMGHTTKPGLSLGPALLVALLGVFSAGANGTNSSHEHDTVQDEELVKSEVDYPLTYFGHSEHVAVIYSHIALMVLAWVFVLPVGKCQTFQYMHRCW